MSHIPHFIWLPLARPWSKCSSAALKEVSSPVVYIFATIWAISILCGCSKTVTVQHYSKARMEDNELEALALSSHLSSSDRWKWSSDGEIEILRKEFQSSHGPQTIHSIGMETCEIDPGQQKGFALIRQLFSGFEDVQVLKVSRPSFVPREISVAQVTASLEGQRVSSLVFSRLVDSCLTEQAFWTARESDWLHLKSTEQLLYSELLTLPPWSSLPIEKNLSDSDKEAVG